MPAIWLLAIALIAALAAWFGAAELPDPARAVTVVLVAVLPAFLLVQGGIEQKQLRDARVEPVYISSMVLIWAIAALALWAARESDMSFARMGLILPDPITGVAWTGALVLGAIGVALLGRKLGWRESPMLEWLLPVTTRERALFVLLSVSAGVGEEMAYRAFLIPALAGASGSRALAVIVSSIAFGMMHGYQQATGALRASLLGVLLAVPFLITGSIVPSMAAHALFDIVAGLLLADWLLPERASRTHEMRRKH
jgi:membrane protease YdiL (CAAX protease family)